MILRLAIAALLILALTGCQFFAELREDILKKGEEAVTTVTETVEKVGSQIEKTKKNVEQKVEDVENAVKEVGEAVEAVKKVTGGEEKTGTSTK